MKKYYGGRTVYGYEIGVLMLDSTFPRIKGDVGNAKTWEYPVLYKKVNGYVPKKVVLELDKKDIQPFIDAAIELEKEGVSAITTSCGFLALFQEELAMAVSVPVFTSALIMLPMISRMIGKNKKVLILTANSNTLTLNHLEAVCGEVKDIPMEIYGTQDQKCFTQFTVENWNEVDIEQCEKDIFHVLDRALLKDNSEFGAILLECTNMPPYSDVIREKYGLPVFDFVSLMNFVHSTVNYER